MQQHVVVCQQQPLGVIPSRAFLFSVFTACRSSNSETGERNSLCFYFTKLWCKNTQKEEGGNTASPSKITLRVSKTTQKLASHCVLEVFLVSQKNSSKCYNCLQLQAQLNLFFLSIKGQVGRLVGKAHANLYLRGESSSLAFWPCL